MRALVGSYYARAAAAFDARPWHQWLVFCAVLLPFFSVDRCVGLDAMLDTFATPDERDVGVQLSAVALGVCEDAALVTLLLVLLSGVDVAVGPRSRWARAVAPSPPRTSLALDSEDETPVVSKRSCCAVGLTWLGSALRRLQRLALHAALVVLAIAPFATDILLLRIRGMRFTFEFVNMYLREINFTEGFAVDPREVRLAKQTVAASLTVAAVLLIVDMLWFDFTRCHLLMLVENQRRHRQAEALPATKKTGNGVAYSVLENGTDPTYEPVPSLDPELATASPSSVLKIQDDDSQHKYDKSLRKRVRCFRAALVTGFSLGVCAALFTMLLLVTHAVPAVVSATALNNSLNELFRTTTKLQFLKSLGDGTIESAAIYIDTTTEEYELFKDDVLYRKTTGFKGPLAFDVAVNASDPPNVVVVAVESFRYQDSLYIVGNKSKALLQCNGNITLTPNFDKWAQRGIAFRNFWSSWQTSRSIESILFGQVPYDHITDTGTSGGRQGVKLNGMPQLFKQKGYETVFTSGARIKYDQWDKFLPAHGFEDVITYKQFRKLAMETKGIKESDWKNEQRAGYWGLHDDLSFDILGDLMYNRTQEQKRRIANGEPKKPFFLNHYTISSHTPFEEMPNWFKEKSLPQLEPLYKGQENEDDVRNYAHVRYFTDQALGKFLSTMKAKGVLDDTIVIVVGDHGQSPEHSLSKPDEDQIATTRVAAALIAEGRLGEYAGMVVDDTAEHFDLLNTLADITGVPDGGFLQSGVGRSLKRAFPPGDRAVWSNNPKFTLAVVKGHRRLKFDRVFSMMQLFDAEQDPLETNDLLPTVSESERSEWESLRERGRRVSRYFKVRWDTKCICKIKC